MKYVGYAAYVVVRFAIGLVARVAWRMKVTGAGNIPEEGAFLLCPVHRSNIDGPLTAAFTKRHMHYLAKESMFRHRWFAALITSMGAIKVNRGAPDRHALKLCVDVLEKGHPLVLFPEGTRREGPIVDQVQEGAAYLALRTGVPIVPVGIAGSESLNPKGSARLKPGRLRVVIGEPLEFEKPGEKERVPRSAIRDKTELLKDRLQQLFDEAGDL